MSEDQEVVIVGKDGKEHVFPQGFDPKKAAGIVAQSVAPDKPTNTLKMRSIASMQDSYDPIGLFPRDPATGERLSPKVSAPPRGLLPVLGGMASAIPAVGLPLRLALGVVGGAAGEGADALAHGERPTIEGMATEGAMQGAISGVPMAAGPVGRVTQAIGRKIGKYVPGGVAPWLAGAGTYKAASAVGMSPAESALAGVAAKKAAPQVIQSAAKGVGTAVKKTGEGVEKLSTLKTPGTVIGQQFGKPMRSRADQVAAAPDAIRKIMLLVRALSGKRD